MNTYIQYKKATNHIAKPFAYLDLDLLDDNISQILSHSLNKQVRIASKSIRSVPVLKRIMEKSERFQGVMCFTASEAIFLSENGFDDLLIGYPISNKDYISSIAHEIKKGKQITLMVDCFKHIKIIEDAVRDENIIIPVCIDVDMSLVYPNFRFGVYRSPLRSIHEIHQLIYTIQQSKQLKLDGLMGYEAQIAGVGDQVKGKLLKNSVVQMLKKQSIQQIKELRSEIIESIKEYDLSFRFVNGGGTGSLASTCKEEVITEVTVGSGFFSPLLFDAYKDFQYKPAAGFALDIVRKPAENIYTCSGGGYVASGATGKDKLPAPYLPENANLHSLEGAGEVQTPILYKGNENLDIGDPVFFRHSKSGELCERFNSLYCISNGEVVDEYATYRGEGKCFL
ncbi:amino acid deaminase/aldolase [Chengkuizengella axinellae]|uniref:Amino acid deaminase/aldolase n=1 Tax=Chengkuizengella axinellae TaxID=3064388 RepID=A0ABT9J646_9BACL|nr:amino acid deaminase/aldolase [Chengkuizengella sp. 2205SS18-9]MDP5277023.1 amino acid deaminase/aldolase [Chengkuizengella sp. 2205SS18-9]